MPAKVLAFPEPRVNAGTINFDFDPLLHAYQMGSYTVPSVTQVLQENNLSPDLSKIPKFVLERKRHIGTQVHKASEFLDTGTGIDWDSLDKRVVPYVMAYEKFLAENKWEPKLIEFQMVALCDGMPYGMTLDREGVLNGERWILDIKCAHDKKHPHWGLQTAAYAFGVAHMNGPWADMQHKRAVLWLRPNKNKPLKSRYEILEHTDDEDWETFRAALKCSYWRRSHIA